MSEAESEAETVGPATVRPVVGGFHPDPSVCRVGEEYVLACSSFEYLPGVPLFTSRDLRSWTQLGNAVSRPEQLGPRSGIASSGLYAPTLRHHGGRLHLVVTNSNAGGGHQLLSAADPAGPWTDGVTVRGVRGIDPDLAWADDDTCLLSWASYDPELPGIAQVPVDPVTGALLGPARSIWTGTGLAFPEAPHVYHLGEWWYLVIAEGGTERGHCVSVARSHSPAGPFEGAPNNPVFSHRSRSALPQNTGHADLIRTPDGGWAMLYLGVLPRGETPGFHVNGRETFLAELDWADGWPVVGETVAGPPPPAFEDRFGGPELDPRWVAPGWFPAEFTQARPGGGRVVKAWVDGSATPPLLVRTAGATWQAEADLDLGPDASAALVVRVDARHELAVTAEPEAVKARLRIGDVRAELGRVPRPAGGAELALRSEAASRGSGGPDTLVALVRTPVGWVELARTDGRYLSTEVAGGFTGRMCGVVAYRDTVSLERFSFRPA